MNTKRKYVPTYELPPVLTEVTLPNGKVVAAGTEITLSPKPGKRQSHRRYRFVDATTNGVGDLVMNLMGPINSGREHFHSCYPTQVQTVHRTKWSR